LYYTVYKITNNLNQKFYIGKHQTKNLNDGYMGSGKLLKAAYKKHGIENFSKEILHVFDTEEEMNAKEKELVVITEDSYNLCDGGHGGFSYIHRNNLKDYSKNAEISGFKNLTSEQRKEYCSKGGKIRASKIKNMTAEERRLIFKNNRRVHSEETKRRIGEARRKIAAMKRSHHS